MGGTVGETEGDDDRTYAEKSCRFAGNLTKQPCFDEMRESGQGKVLLGIVRWKGAVSLYETMGRKGDRDMRKSDRPSRFVIRRTSWG